MKNAKPDFERRRRCGIPEVIYAEGKTIEDNIRIGKSHLKECGRAIYTKLEQEPGKKVMKALSSRDVDSEYNTYGKTLVVKKKDKTIEETGSIGILTAGTSDIPVAEEAKVIAEELGLKVLTEYDVGIAGIHRLYPALDNMIDADVLIVAAGMEGALPAVVSGLTDKPVIGVPTSVGYGTGKGGKTALYAMLNSCTPVAVVNIDNGFGAASIAAKMIRRRKNGRH